MISKSIDPNFVLLLSWTMFFPFFLMHVIYRFPVWAGAREDMVKDLKRDLFWYEDLFLFGMWFWYLLKLGWRKKKIKKTF
ncbi:hypothetical protein HNP93_000983 [Methanococcus maripaludis]|uniref:Uncharacterized protein n=1 Tax=Methanococcus maripaludis TaxID=39152 RepID=A0A7J9P503_METMI|nr:hypothetical protein [Methanococcus maripaludis]